jgi:hypothetical protein
MIWAQLRRCARMAATEDRAGDRTVTAPVPLTAGAGGRAPAGPVAPAGWTSAHAATGPIIPRRRSGSGPPGIPAGAPRPHICRDGRGTPDNAAATSPVSVPPADPAPSPGRQAGRPPPRSSSPRPRGGPVRSCSPRQDRAARCGSRKAEPAGSTPGRLTPARPGDPRPASASSASCPLATAGCCCAPRTPLAGNGSRQATG